MNHCARNWWYDATFSKLILHREANIKFINILGGRTYKYQDDCRLPVSRQHATFRWSEIKVSHRFQMRVEWSYK